MLRIWTAITIVFILILAIWAIFGVVDINQRISIFSIIAVIMTAITSVTTITENNKQTKEREIEILIVKEKQNVFEHFYNALFAILSSVKKDKPKKIPKDIESEMLNFKRGLMNWGSEELIKSYLLYEKELVVFQSDNNSADILKSGEKFLRSIRKEMGFKDSGNVNIMSVILTSEAREQLENDKRV